MGLFYQYQICQKKASIIQGKSVLQEKLIILLHQLRKAKKTELPKSRINFRYWKLAFQVFFFESSLNPVQAIKRFLNNKDSLIPVAWWKKNWYQAYFLPQILLYIWESPQGDENWMCFQKSRTTGTGMEPNFQTHTVYICIFGMSPQ